MILTTPLLQRLAVKGPVHVVATPANAAVLANHPAVSSVIVFDKRGTDRGWGGMRRVAQRLRATGAQTAYLAQGSFRTAAVARLAGIPYRIGFATSQGRFLYTAQRPFQRDRHHAERLWQLASDPGDPAHEPLDAFRPSLFPGSADDAAVNDLLHHAGVQPHEWLIAVAPGSVWATKRWPYFAELAAELVASLGPLATTTRIVVIGAGGEAPLASAIIAAVHTAGGAAAIDATGRLTLLGSAALLARARVLVTNDSAPLHLASAMNTPTIALFGPTVPSLGFGPLATVRESMGHPTLDCRPCTAHGPVTCPLGHWRCMRELSSSLVALEAHRIVRASGDERSVAVRSGP